MMGRCRPDFILGGSDGRGRFQAVHYRHLNIHEHNVERFPLDCVKSLLSIRDRQRRMSGFLRGDAKPLAD